MKNKGFFLALMITVAVGVVALVAYLPARMDEALLASVAKFPMSFGEWSGKEIPVDERTYEILETRNLFIREYQNTAGEKVYLYVVYSEDNRKVSHPPELCLQGGGETITSEAKMQLTPSIEGTMLSVQKGDTRQVFVYWFKAGKEYTNSYLKQQMKVALARLSGKRLAGALIRVSSVTKGKTGEEVTALLKRFTAEIEPLLAQYVP